MQTHSNDKVETKHKVMLAFVFFLALFGETLGDNALKLLGL